MNVTMFAMVRLCVTVRQKTDPAFRQRQLSGSSWQESIHLLEKSIYIAFFDHYMTYHSHTHHSCLESLSW